MMDQNKTVVIPGIFSTFKTVHAGLSTRLGGVSPEPLGMNLSYNVGDDAGNVDENRKIFFNLIGASPASMAFPYQIHSPNISVVTAPGRYEACDALITNKRGIFLAVTVADCVPILLYDPVTESIAAVHSGWRGSKAEILSAAVKAMERNYAVEPKNLFAYIGHAAGGLNIHVR